MAAATSDRGRASTCRETRRAGNVAQESLRIGVVGAGISGLTFAAAMRRLSPATNVELYERDESATSRRQGYSLGLKGDAGLTVKTLDLYDLLAKEAITITNFVICDQRGARLLELPATGRVKRLTQRVRRASLSGTPCLGQSATPPFILAWLVLAIVKTVTPLKHNS